MNKMNEILNDVIHTASQAIISDDEKIKRQAMADIVDALANVIPAEISGRACLPETATNDPQGFAKFLKASDGVQFVRFPGKDETRLVASRKGTSGNQNTIFEIVIDHDVDVASVYRNGEVIFKIAGLTIGHSIVEKLAISSMHRYLREYSMNNAKKKRKRARKAAEREGK